MKYLFGITGGLGLSMEHATNWKVFASVAHQQVEPIFGTTDIAVNLHPPNSPTLASCFCKWNCSYRCTISWISLKFRNKCWTCCKFGRGLLCSVQHWPKTEVCISLSTWFEDLRIHPLYRNNPHTEDDLKEKTKNIVLLLSPAEIQHAINNVFLLCVMHKC